MASLGALLLLALTVCCVTAQTACPDGFSGPGCALCNSPAACAASTGDAGSTCSSDLAFAPTSTLKSWACSLPTTGLSALLEPGSLLLQCSTGLSAGQTLPVAGAGTLAPAGNCSIAFRLASGNKAEVKCAASDCTLAAGQASLACSTTSCSCPSDSTCGGVALVANLVGTVSGAASLTCAAGGACNLKLSTLLDINATCTSAECLPGAGATPVPVPAPSVPVVTLPPPAVVAASPPPATPAPGPPADGTCGANFEGPGCVLCKTDFGCMTGDYTGAGDTAATCSRSFPLASNTMLKSWSCQVDQGTLLTDVISNLVVQCRTGLEAGEQLTAAAPAPAPLPPLSLLPITAPPPPAAGSSTGGEQPISDVIGDIVDAIPPPTSEAAAGRRRLLAVPALARVGPPLCQISFDADVDGKQSAVLCNADNCTFVPGSPNIVCAKTTCACPGSATCNDIAIVNSVAKSVAGKAELECPAPAGTSVNDTSPRSCVLKLEGMIISQFGATCQAAECLVPTSSELTGTATNGTSSSGSVDTNPVLAAIPLFVLVIIAVSVGTYTYTQRHMWGYRISGADLAQLEALAAKPDLGSKRVGELVFENLTVSVPLRPRDAAQKASALRRKAMPGSSPALSDSYSGGLGRLLAAAKSRLAVGGSKDVEFAGNAETGHGQDSSEAAAAATSADFVVGLHQPAAHPGRWYIVNGCSGTLRGGEVVGVLGPSGCGKTTLLGGIAGSAMELGSSSVLSGSVLVDGRRRRESMVAYVPQSDVLIPSLTVQECLRYSALLRLPQNTSPLDLQVHIERVLDELGLRHIADAQVGGSGGIRGVSGGERRRVTIGMELVTDPAILVLDEPTSGLDSYTADNLLRSLKGVAEAGRVVLASLHQPSRDVFMGLDQVVLMGHGRMLYMGPPAEAEAWFDRHGLPCPAGTAIAEHMLRIASDAPSIRHLLQSLEQESEGQPGLPRRANSPSTGKLLGLATSSASSSEEDGEGPVCGPSSTDSPAEQSKLSISKSPFASPAVAVAGQQLAPAGSVQGKVLGNEAPSGAVPALEGPHSQPHRRNTHYGRQLSVMFWRTFVDIVRNPALLLLHCGVAVVMGLVTGLVFYQSDFTNVGVQNRMGGTFFALAFLGFTSLTTVDLLITERQVVTREVRGGYYSPSAYLLSKLTLDAILLRVLPAILYFFPFYYLAAFQSEAALAAAYCLILVTFSCVVGAMSMSLTVASNTAGQASFAMNFLLLFSLVFTGFLVNVNSIPAWIRWVHYLSVFYYAFEAMINGELTGLTFDFQASGSATIPNVKGEIYLQTLGFNPSRTTRDIGILVAIYFLMVLLALALFYLRLPRQATVISHDRKNSMHGRTRRLLKSSSGAVALAVRGAGTKTHREATTGASGRGGAAEPAATAAATASRGAGGNGEQQQEGLRKRWQMWNPVFGAGAMSAPDGPAAPPAAPLAAGLSAHRGTQQLANGVSQPAIASSGAVQAAGEHKRFSQQLKAAA